MTLYLRILLIYPWRNVLNFSELESENVSVSQSISLSPHWGRLETSKWSDLVEILYTRSLGESLGVFFSILQKFDF